MFAFLFLFCTIFYGKNIYSVTCKNFCTAVGCCCCCCIFYSSTLFRLLLFGGYQDFISYFIFRHTRIQRNNNDNNNNKNNNNTNKLSVAQQLRRKNSYEMMQAVKWRRRGRRPRRKGSGEASTQKMAAHQKYTLDLIL